MSEPIKPALTAEVWDYLRGQHFEYFAALSSNTADERIGAEGGQEERHAVAALALYGQPFGFTREDVAQLHKAADAIDSEWGYPGGRGIEEHKPGQPLRELADRIESLLPPDMGTIYLDRAADIRIPPSR